MNKLVGKDLDLWRLNENEYNRYNIRREPVEAKKEEIERYNFIYFIDKTTTNCRNEIFATFFPTNPTILPKSKYDRKMG